MTVMPLIVDLAEQGIFPYVNGNKVVMTPAAKLTDALPLRSGNYKCRTFSNSQGTGRSWLSKPNHSLMIQHTEGFI